MPRDVFQAVFFGCQRPLNPPRFSHTWGVFFKTNSELATISWLPRSLRIRLRGRPEVGKNFTLHETADFVGKIGSRTRQWGPFRIRKKLYDLALARIDQLESGRIQYVVLDNDYRPDVATNCIHALSDIGLTSELLATGARRGFSATSRVVRYFEDCGMILGPGDGDNRLADLF